MMPPKDNALYDCKRPDCLHAENELRKAEKQIIEWDKERKLMQDVIEKIRGAWKKTESFSQGTDIINCIEHANDDITKRPDGCKLCHADMVNFIHKATAVNKFLNKQFDVVLDALEGEK